MRAIIFGLSLCFLYIALAACGNDTPKTAEEVTNKHDFTQLYEQIDSIARNFPGKLGMAVLNIETGDTFSYNGRTHMPMQSTYKFPLALLVADHLDKGTLSLDQIIHIDKAELQDRETHSPMRDKYGVNNFGIPLHELLEYTVAMSDNIGCDILFNLAGGPDTVNAYIHSKGINGINIVSTEDELHRDWKNQYLNWCEPVEMVRLLSDFYQEKVISKTNTDTIRSIMERSPFGNGRIKGLLPAGTVVAHKTGTCMPDAANSTTVNDIGIITLPDGNHLVIAVYITDAPNDVAAGEAVIAQVAKAAYDDAIAK